MGRRGGRRNRQGNCPLTICLFVEHGFSKMSHSIYLIQPDLSPVRSYEVDSDGFFVDDAQPISPVLTFERENQNSFLFDPAMFKLGPLIYFFGGCNYGDPLLCDSIYRDDVSDEFKLAVRVLDTNHPELGLRPVASMNAPKQTPCVFAADGRMYALGSGWSVTGEEIMMNRDTNPSTGCFERYDPKSDMWKVLPDPPLPLGVRIHNTWSDHVTVVDRHVFIGNPLYLAIFNLDTEEWVPLPPQLPAKRFHYGSIYYDGYLYYLRGQRGPGTYSDDPERDFPLEFVRRGPLHIRDKNDPSRLLRQKCLSLENAQVIVTAGQLDGDDALYTRAGFETWRKFFHLGDHVFCYVVTTQLVQDYDFTVNEPQCRGVWIKFFKDVQADQNDKAKFRLLGSFCYKICTPFHNSSMFIGCRAFGSVPDALTCDLTKSKPLEAALDHAKWIRKDYDWINLIPPNSIYHDILTHTSSDNQTSKPQTPKPQYQSSKRDALRYMRAVIYHHRAKDRNTDLREVEMCLSQLFVDAIPSIYGGMCMENIFL